MRRLIFIGALICINGCAGIEGVPALSALDAVGRGVAGLVGWCEDNGGAADTIQKAKDAFERRDYADAVLLLDGMMTELRKRGVEVPEDVEVTLRLAQGALAAEGIQEGMRVLSK